MTVMKGAALTLPPLLILLHPGQAPADTTFHLPALLGLPSLSSKVLGRGGGCHRKALAHAATRGVLLQGWSLEKVRGWGQTQSLVVPVFLGLLRVKVHRVGLSQAP